MTMIRSKDEMIKFIEQTENFFGCPEDYERFYGLERRWDEETGKIQETTREYYNRGGCFKNIPDKYPCVIYFPYAMETRSMYVHGICYKSKVAIVPEIIS